MDEMWFIPAHDDEASSTSVLLRRSPSSCHNQVPLGRGAGKEMMGREGGRKNLMIKSVKTVSSCGSWILLSHLGRDVVHFGWWRNSGHLPAPCRS